MGDDLLERLDGIQQTCQVMTCCGLHKVWPPQVGCPSRSFTPWVARLRFIQCSRPKIRSKISTSTCSKTVMVWAFWHRNNWEWMPIASAKTTKTVSPFLTVQDPRFLISDHLTRPHCFFNPGWPISPISIWVGGSGDRQVIWFWKAALPCSTCWSLVNLWDCPGGTTGYNSRCVLAGCFLRGWTGIGRKVHFSLSRHFFFSMMNNI